MRSVDPATVTAWYSGGQEVALVDVREEWAYCRGHALLASSCPLSSLELMVEDLIPRRDANVVVMDGGGANADALGRAAVERLENIGFSRVGLLADGACGWEAAGYRLFSGIHVFSKLFGEYIERIHGTPEVEASHLAQALANGGNCIVVDTRPRHEFAQSTIPGSINVPAGELLRTLPALVADCTTDVVVHCGGRTRGIVAAQSLIAAGLPQRVSVLKNGTIGWRLGGFETVRGTGGGTIERPARADVIRAYADRLLDGGSITRIDGAGLEKAIAESDAVTTYFVDVRSAEEYRAGHHSLARNVAAGQLVQEMDRTLGVRHGRVVLLDDLGDRAAFAGHWIVRAGWRDVRWFSYEDCRASLVCGPWRTLGSAEGRGVACNYVCAGELAAMVAAGRALVVDLSSSIEFERARIPGALFAIRSQLPNGLDAVLPDGAMLVLTSEDGRRAGLASHELVGRYGDRMRLLLGGNQAWRDTGMAMDSGPGTFLNPPHDVRRSIYDNPTDVFAAMRGYIEWEIGLIDDARNERYLPFAA